MLFNNARCKNLTPDYVNSASGLELHQFKWLQTEELIGTLPARWNHLVGYNRPSPDAALVHFTLGGPYFEEYAQCEFAAEWRVEKEAMLYAAGATRSTAQARTTEMLKAFQKKFRSRSERIAVSHTNVADDVPSELRSAELCFHGGLEFRDAGQTPTKRCHQFNRLSYSP